MSIEAWWPKLSTTVARNLNELEDAGYVSGDLPRDGRRRRRTQWSLQHERLHADLRALIQATTPALIPSGTG